MLATSLDSLESQGYTIVRNGTMSFVDGGGFGNNPDSVYGMWDMGGTVPTMWPLGENEVAVWLGCTPPLVEYWSFSHVVVEKQPGWHLVWADPADSINMLVANSTGPSDHNMNATAALVLSADATSAMAAGKALGEGGVPSTAINTLVVPSQIVGSLGQSNQASQMQVMLRAALFANADQKAAYTAGVWPVTILAAPASATPNPFPLPALRPRGSATTESQYQPFVDQLVGNITMRFESEGMKLASTTYLTPTNFSDGRTCLSDDTFCAAGTRDALYTMTGPEFSMGAADDIDTVFVVAGVNHAQTFKATYSNIALNQLEVEGFGAVSNAQFNGSARYFSPATPNGEAMFAYVVARNCSAWNAFCLAVTTDMLAPGAPFSVIGRAYLEPSSKVGPLFSQLVQTRVLTFQRAAHPSL